LIVLLLRIITDLFPNRYFLLIASFIAGTTDVHIQPNQRGLCQVLVVLEKLLQGLNSCCYQEHQGA